MRRALVPLLLLLALLAAGCGRDGSTSQEPAAAKRIVSMSPTATEMLFAIGAGPQVVAALRPPPGQPGGGEVVDPSFVGAQAQLAALGRERVQHRVQNGVERPSCRT